MYLRVALSSFLCIFYELDVFLSILFATSGSLVALVPTDETAHKVRRCAYLRIVYGGANTCLS